MTYYAAPPTMVTRWVGVIKYIT
eukprot:SAG31_NODE_9114_length_1331_cov_1.285714_1_plen_22_part_01